MAPEKGISDLKTIRRILQNLENDIAGYRANPSESNLRGIGNMASLLAERIVKRQKE